MNLTRLESEVFSLERLYASSLVELKIQKKILGQKTKIFGPNQLSKKNVWSEKLFCREKVFGP